MRSHYYVDNPANTVLRPILHRHERTAYLPREAGVGPFGVNYPPGLRDWVHVLPRSGAEKWRPEVESGGAECFSCVGAEMEGWDSAVLYYCDYELLVWCFAYSSVLSIEYRI